jgi:16S rRNA (adenine1518-N6/adenine1519-N6)-dimethyltransferase
MAYSLFAVGRRSCRVVANSPTLYRFCDHRLFSHSSSTPIDNDDGLNRVSVIDSIVFDDGDDFAATLAKRRQARVMNSNPDLAKPTVSTNEPVQPLPTHSSKKVFSGEETMIERQMNKKNFKRIDENLRETLESRRLAKLLANVSNAPITFLSSPSQSKQVNSSDRPFTLPSGVFRPKQSLGQNYLNDQNTVNKFIDCFVTQRKLRLNEEDSVDQTGERVIEIGPGAGALTRDLVKRFPNMLAVEIDQRSVELLSRKLPEANVLHHDILEFDWRKHFLERNGIEDNVAVPAVVSEGSLAAVPKRGRGLSIVANLPYHIVSQVLFSLADNHKFIALAVVTMQYEVALRITAKPRTPEYGIPSVVFQLYGETLLNFKIPPTVFYPVPKVDSALVTVDFTKPNKELKRVYGVHLRK